MKRNDFMVILDNSSNWTRDRYGNYKYVGTPFSKQQYRFKIQTTSARLEYLLQYGDGSKKWCNYASDYFKNIEVYDDGTMKLGITVKYHLI